MGKSNDIGKWFEDKVQDALKQIQSKHTAMFHRFPDTRAARNILPAQPGDHMLIMNGMAILIEEKCSDVHASLRNGFSALFPKEEAAQHRKWHRAGMPSWILFCNYSNKQVELWQGYRLATLRATGLRIPKDFRPTVRCDLADLESCILSMAQKEAEQET